MCFAVHKILFRVLRVHIWGRSEEALAARVASARADGDRQDGGAECGLGAGGSGEGGVGRDGVGLWGGVRGGVGWGGCRRRGFRTPALVARTMASKEAVVCALSVV